MSSRVLIIPSKVSPLSLSSASSADRAAGGHAEPRGRQLNKQLEASLTWIGSGLNLRLAGGNGEMDVFRKN